MPLTKEQKQIVKRVWKEYIMDYLAGAVVGFVLAIALKTNLADVSAFVTALGGLTAIGSFIAVVKRTYFNKGITEEQE